MFQKADLRGGFGAMKVAVHLANSSLHHGHISIFHPGLCHSCCAQPPKGPSTESLRCFSLRGTVGRSATSIKMDQNGI